MPITTLLFATIGIPFLGGLIAAFLPTNARNAEAWLAGAIALIDVAILAFLYPLVTDGNVVRAEIEWIPSAGLNFVVRLDGFAWMFALLIASVGFLVVLYARYYMSPADPVPRLFSFLLAFMGSMLGMVLSGNLVQLVFFWELTSLSSFMLIGYWHHNASGPRRRAHGADRDRQWRAFASWQAFLCWAISLAAMIWIACWHRAI